MSGGNNKYVSVPHGLGVTKDRNKVYSIRPSNPLAIPRKIAEVPLLLARRYE
jgi:hypothetical protein